MNRLRDGLLLALGTLTAFRVPQPRVVDRAAGRWCVLLAAAPGLLLGLGCAAVGLLAGRLPAAAVGLLAVGWLLLATRAFHADGLADLVDGLTSGYDRDRSLQIMKTGDVGPAGAASIVLTIGLDAVLIGGLCARGESARVVGAVVLSRVALPLACHRVVPSARPGGLGALVAGTVSTLDLAVLVVVACGLGTLVIGPAALTMTLATLTAAVGVVARAGSRLGGVTGDVLGAVVEISLVAALLAASL